ncbi:MAG: hypothetical protein CM15mP120_21060 [Pseudomonadota bacterium]|nr:MAG: hypothetical protein CM15mP120_21060 [Pseudomonadota bacterium]
MSFGPSLRLRQHRPYNRGSERLVLLVVADTSWLDCHRKTPVFNVHRAAVVMHGAVIVAIKEFLAQRVWQRHALSDFLLVVAFIGQSQGLIVDEFV